jgi:tripartite-type tricarboxylate transporter receptor subunit TctC
LARLTSEYNVFVLPANSPFKNMAEVVAQLKKDPAPSSGAAARAAPPSTLLRP